MPMHASPTKVWEALVNPALTKEYMFGCEAVSTWHEGSPLLWKGTHEGNEIIYVKGSVVQIIQEQLLVYTTFDPHSDIQDVPENYLTVTYALEEKNGVTVLTVTQGDFSTVASGDRRYQEALNNGEGWNPILLEIKKLVERQN